MTANWFEGKVKYTRVGEDGRERKVTDMYLLDVMSYTEAESRLIEEMSYIIRGDFWIAGLKKSNITEVVEPENENDDRWYKAKVAIIDADEVSGKEKRTYQYYLVGASNADRALENLNRSLSQFVVPWEVASIADTQFVDIFPYYSDGAEENSENTKQRKDEEDDVSDN